jgi:hypothetical protein
MGRVLTIRMSAGHLTVNLSHDEFQINSVELGVS